jgi:hypothetical protein
MTLTSDHKNVYDLVKAQKTIASIYFLNNSNVTKNDYGDVIGKGSNTPVNFYTFPVESNPPEKSRLKHGIKTPVNMMAYLTYYEIIKKGYTDEDFQPENMKAVILNKEYKIKYCKEFSHNADGFLYMVIAGDVDGK